MTDRPSMTRRGGFVMQLFPSPQQAKAFPSEGKGDRLRWMRWKAEGLRRKTPTQGSNFVAVGRDHPIPPPEACLHP